VDEFAITNFHEYAVPHTGLDIKGMYELYGPTQF
jgi:hypothetical protein